MTPSPEATSLLVALRAALEKLDGLLLGTRAQDARQAAQNQWALLEDPLRFLSGEMYYLGAGYQRVFWGPGDPLLRLGILYLDSGSGVTAHGADGPVARRWGGMPVLEARRDVERAVYALLQGPWEEYQDLVVSSD